MVFIACTMGFPDCFYWASVHFSAGLRPAPFFSLQPLGCCLDLRRDCLNYLELYSRSRSILLNIAGSRLVLRWLVGSWWLAVCVGKFSMDIARILKGVWSDFQRIWAGLSLHFQCIWLSFRFIGYAMEFHLIFNCFWMDAQWVLEGVAKEIDLSCNSFLKEIQWTLHLFWKDLQLISNGYWKDFQ